MLRTYYLSANMINFCHPVMKPGIECSTVCTDGNEITNLISKDPNLQRKGFIAYYAIRPPVTVELNFKCKINVNEVILWSEVGSQRSTGFELYAACVDNKTCSSNYEKIAYGFINGKEKGMMFSRYSSVSHGDSKNLVKSVFFGNKRALLNNINKLAVKIIKTSSVPCIARIEVWGQPSDSCTEATRKYIKALWEQYNTVQVMYSKQNTEICTDNNTSSIDAIENSSFKIPDEFLDPITYKLMALPMTLPCGKIVDQSTLDKFKEYEATWGRPLSDPFTGKMFTDGCHPVLATSLKARIDKFLIDHADVPEVKTLPRTVGVKIPSAAPRSSYLYQTISSAVKTEKNEKEIKRSYEVFSKEFDTNKKQRVEQNLTLNHEERVNRSLRSAVRNVLTGLPSFTKFEDMQIKTEECIKCSSKHVLFKLPCKHFLCRSCLVHKETSTNMKCAACKAAFQSGDLIRQYL